MVFCADHKQHFEHGKYIHSIYDYRGRIILIYEYKMKNLNRFTYICYFFRKKKSFLNYTMFGFDYKLFAKKKNSLF